MKLLQWLLTGVLVVQLGFPWALAQPILIQPESPFQQQAGNGIANLRVTSQSKDGTLAILTFDYTYDGTSGASALLLPVIEKRNQKGIASWFGADPVAIGAGRGIVSAKVKYFNDEPGVPPQFTSDRVRVLILNNNGVTVIAGIPFLKTINWGSANAPAVLSVAASGPSAEILAKEAEAREKARLKAEADAKRLAEDKVKADEKTRQLAEQKARQEAEAKEREEARLRAEAEATAREEARLKAEAETRRLAEEKRVAEAKALEEAKARAEAERKAEAEAKRLAAEKALAEKRAQAEAAARAEAEHKAEAEARRLAEEKDLAEKKARAEAQARVEAERKAEAEAKRLVEEKALAEKKAQEEAKARAEAERRAEAEAKRLAAEKLAAEKKAQEEADQQEKERQAAIAKEREEARLAAEAQAKRLAEEKRVAEAKAKADAEAREKARLAAEAETKRLAEEKRVAEAKAKAEAEEREKARLAAEAEAKRLAEEKRVAEAKAKAEAEEREKARLAAEAEAKRLTEEKRVAEAKAREEAEVREKARLAAETEAKRLAEEKRIAEAKAQAEAETREAARKKAEAEAAALAEAQAKAEAERQEKARLAAAAEAEAQRLAEEKALAAKSEAAPATPAPAPVLAANLKTKVTNVDVVNRSLDRSQMTIGVEFEYHDSFSKPMMGVEISRLNDPEASRYFSAAPAEIGRSRRNFLLFPVKFQPPANGGTLTGAYQTDKVMVYLQDAAASVAQRLNLFPATMLLMWRPPANSGAVASGANDAKSGAAKPPPAVSSIELDDFKQTDASTGYVTVKYYLVSGLGKLRARILQGGHPESAKWFEIKEEKVNPGRGLQLLDFTVKADAAVGGDSFTVDTLQLELLDAGNRVIATQTKTLSGVWTKPKPEGR